MASKAKASAANQRRTVKERRTVKKARPTKSGSSRLASGAGHARTPEVVLDFHATGTELVFRVHSGGCTEAKHFELDVKRRRGATEITLIRRVPDNCKGEFPEGTEITFGYRAAGLDRDDIIQLINPIG